MPPFLSSLASRVTPSEAAASNAFARFAPAAAFHLAAFVVMIWSEFGAFRLAVFVFAWGLTNFCWLVLLRRPGLSAALSFAMLVSLVAVSRFKFAELSMTARAARWNAAAGANRANAFGAAASDGVTRLARDERNGGMRGAPVPGPDQLFNTRHTGLLQYKN